MELIADGLLFAGAVAAAIYCWVLSRRVSALKSLDSGLGGAISELSRQVEDIRATLDQAKAATDGSLRELSEKTARAEVASGRLELLLASIHEGEGEAQPAGPRVARARTATAEARREDSEDDTETEAQREDVLHALRNIVQGMKA